MWNTCRVAIPHLLAAGGGSIVITGSTASVVGLPFFLPYVAAKHALVGVARSFALEFADRNIRVNLIHPTGVDTPQGHSPVLPALLDERPDLRGIFDNSLPVARIDAIDSATRWSTSPPTRPVTSRAPPFPSTRVRRSADAPRERHFGLHVAPGPAPGRHAGRLWKIATDLRDDAGRVDSNSTGQRRGA